MARTGAVLGLAWTGYAAAVCAVVLLTAHVSAALSPATPGPLVRAGHLAAAFVLLSVAVLAVALVRPPSRRVPTAVLIVAAFAAAVMALAAALGGLVARAALAGARVVGASAGVAGMGGTDGPEGAAVRYGRWVVDPDPATGVGGFEPWAFALGLLLVAAAAHRLGEPAARRIWLVTVALGVLRLLWA
jgi:uncharacterized membrane protein